MRRYAVEGLLGPVLLVALAVPTVLSADGAARTAATLAAFVVVEAGLLAYRLARVRLGLAGLVVTFAAGVAAMVLAPGGFAEVPVLVASARLPLVLPRRWVEPALVAAGVAFGVAVAVISHSAVGLLAGLGAWFLGQRTLDTAALEAERDRAVGLLAEVEAARGAEAEAAAAAERVRIARDLHDVLAHSLAGLSVQLQAVRAVAAREGVGPAVTAPLDAAATLARDGVVEARRAVSALRDPDGPGLDDLPMLVERFPGTARLRTEGAGTLPAAEAYAVYRAVQEALTNAARYAPGARVEVALAWSATRLVATVANEPPERPPPVEPAAGGSGLAGMAERLGQVGGTVTAGPAADGWLVRLEVPRGAPPVTRA